MNIKLEVGKGVMSKDGKTPYALKTLHATSKDGWISPYDYTVGNLCRLINDKSITSIEVIDEANQQFTLTIER